MNKDADIILKFWFEECEEKSWWVKDPEFDAMLRDRFGDLVEQAATGDLDNWAETADGSRAFIILLDQFTRNIYRDCSKAFAADDKALSMARNAISKGFDKGLDMHQRVFMYMPFEHSEDIADQDESCRLIGEIGSENYLKFAHAHRDIIVKFGRYPHRNAILGRKNTRAEDDYLKDPNAGF